MPEKYCLDLSDCKQKYFKLRKKNKELKFQKLKNDRNIAISQAKPNRNDVLNRGMVRAHFRLTLK